MPAIIPAPGKRVYFGRRLAASEQPRLADSLTRSAGDPRMQKALDYLRAHCCEGVTLKDVAERACMSEYHFSRVFHESVGLTFQEYLIRLRLRRAKHLLKEAPHLSITAIAHETGFGSLRNLESHFHKREHRSPSDYRAP